MPVLQSLFFLQLQIEIGMQHSNRRTFLRTGVVAGTVISTFPQFLFSCQSGQSDQSTEKTLEDASALSTKYVDHLGLQLYTLRDAFAANPEKTLQDIANIGYKELELHNVNLLPTYASKLNELGLAVTSSHFSSAYLTGKWEILEAFGASRPQDTSFSSIVTIAAEHKLPYLVMPMLFPEERGDLDHYRGLAATFNRRGEECKQAGVHFCYHNHSFEFEPMGDATPFEVLMAETDPELVLFELDLFWVKASGNDPVSLMKKYPNRIRLLHLKDLKPGLAPSYKTMEMAQQHPDAFLEVGQGSLNFTEILNTAAEIGVTNCYVEQDHSPDPLASIAKSYQYLSELGL